MTLLEINLTDVLSETDPDDRVIVWAPVMREGPAGQLVGPRRKTIPLTDGVGSDEVVPGPLMVQVQCKAMSDTRPREVVVPEEGPVTLTALFDSSGAFTYSPAVLGQVAQMRDDAEAARDVSMEAAAATVAGADMADEHATQAADDRRQTGEDRTQTGLDRQAAAQSATNAATSATTAEGHKTTVQTALAGALLYSGTGFPNGVVAAPVGSIYTDTAATAGAVRWIKTSGTGNTGWKVEYGDTGLRLVPTEPEAVTAGQAQLIRQGNTVTAILTEVAMTQGSGSARLFAIPEGFRGEIGGKGAIGFVRQATNALVTERLAIYSSFVTWVGSGTASVGDRPSASMTGSFSWRTPDSWPTILPGTPA